MMRNRKVTRVVAIYLLLQFSTQTFLPTISYALTAGPSQPEFSSFEPVGTSEMVDLFTGDFTYNLPLLEVPGPNGSSYPLGLSYHSGVTPEEDASWVGYGWTLNAGAINRNTRGFPDDFNNEPITVLNTTPKNWTIATGGGISAGEIFGTDLVSFNTLSSIRYNNYRGFGFSKGVGLTLGKGLVSLGYNVSDNQGSFSLDLNPRAILSLSPDKAASDFRVGLEKIKNPVVRKLAQQTTRQVMRQKNSPNVNLFGSRYGVFTYSEFGSPSSTPAYKGSSINVSVSVRPTGTPLPIGFAINSFGSYSSQESADDLLAKAFGYMYSSEATASESMSDYHVENESGLEKRDVFLGVPFSDADIFVASGSGINGGFRLYNRSVGHYGPREITSSTAITNVSIEASVGVDTGPGTDLLGTGSHALVTKDWIDPSTSGGKFFKFKDRHHFTTVTTTPVDEPVFFRFNNDLAGSWGDNHNDNPVQFRLIPAPFKKFTLETTTFNYSPNKGRTNRSSYIAFTTNKEIQDYQITPSGFNSLSYKAYSKRKDIDQLANRSTNPDRIGEIAIFNESGSRYVYGLPVYNRKEETHSYGARGISASQLDKNYISYYQNPEFNVGEIKNGTYASTYLITEINTPDYIDTDLDGPTPDDFGGYTRFVYERIFGGAGTWFKWRMPYKGLFYKKNLLSDKMDDFGSVSHGEKEVYYTKSIETKTHVAFFDYSQQRDDGFGAMDETNSMNASKMPNTAGDATTNAPKPRRLNRIDLYPLSSVIRDSDNNPIKPASSVPALKSVIFQYYEGTEAASQLGKNIANGAPNTGKLTLKGVYFEYNGSAKGTPTKIKISPYTFEYKYPQALSLPYPSIYSSFQAEYSAVASSSVLQNPNYTVQQSDAWGNYQAAGAYQYSKMRTWVYQGSYLNQNVNFDPAAYQLKVIKLPSGGQVHVQYEQDDYAYVQNQPAHVMAKLIKPTTVSDTKFYIDADSIGVSPIDRQALCDSINMRYGSAALQRKKMYFKFLISLDHSASDPMPDLSTCNAEYITGYVDVQSAFLEGGKVAIQLASPKTIQQTTMDFAYAHTMGKLDKSTNCDVSVSGLNDKASAVELVRQLINAYESTVNPNFILDLNLVNYDLSYLRVPIVSAKKGGGVRVKRLLMYDDTLEGTILYGSEYSYKVQDKNGRLISSGVASNEPQAIREENILTDFIPRKGQTWLSKLIAGRDKKISEGPIGESVLPGASVGYSRVAVTSIHSKKTNPGFSVTEYFTCRDFPMEVRQTPISRTQDYGIKLLLLVNTFKNHEFATQGFSFINNSMHGQIKRTASYSGNYDGANRNEIHTLKKSVLISEVANEFFKPGEPVKMMSRFGDVTEKNPGREVDIALAQKSVVESTVDINFELDATVGFFGPFPNFFLSSIPTVTKTDGSTQTHVVSKVIQYPAILKRVRAYQDGIYHTTENLAFDEYSGQPVSVKSYDEFKGAYLSQSIPASWEYKNYHGKGESEDKLMATGPDVSYSISTELATPVLYILGTGSCRKATEIVNGDLLEFPGKYFYHVQSSDYSNGRFELAQSQLSTGAISNGSIPNFWILQSGKNNQTAETAGSIVFHDPDQTKMDLSTIVLAESARYGTSSFSVDLQSNVSTILTTARGSANPISGSFTLTGTYSGINMSAYSNKAPSCTADWSNAIITGVKISYTADQKSMTMNLMEFQIDCNNGVPSANYVVIKNN